MCYTALACESIHRHIHAVDHVSQHVDISVHIVSVKFSDHSWPHMLETKHA